MGILNEYNSAIRLMISAKGDPRDPMFVLGARYLADICATNTTYASTPTFGDTAQRAMVGGWVGGCQQSNIMYVSLQFVKPVGFQGRGTNKIATSVEA